MQGTPVADAALPGLDASASPRELPLQQRLRLSIVAVPGEEHVYRVEGNFPASQVVWMASGGDLEVQEGSVRWQPPQSHGSFLLQAIVDAGPLGVAVGARVIDL